MQTKLRTTELAGWNLPVGKFLFDTVLISSAVLKDVAEEMRVFSAVPPLLSLPLHRQLVWSAALSVVPLPSFPLPIFSVVLWLLCALDLC